MSYKTIVFCRLEAENIDKLDIYSDNTMSPGTKVFDFNKIVPMPISVQRTVSPAAQELCLLYFLEMGFPVDAAFLFCEKYGISGVSREMFPPEIGWYELRLFLKEEYRDFNKDIDMSLAGIGGNYIRNIKNHGCFCADEWAEKNWGASPVNNHTIVCDKNMILFNTYERVPWLLIKKLAEKEKEVKFRLTFWEMGGSEPPITFDIFWNDKTKEVEQKEVH